MDGSSDQSTSKEVELLSRVAANHLFLAQYEPLRAILLSLRNRNPELAISILKTIVLKGGRFDGVLWSSNCSSPPQLAWMALHELEKMSDDSCFGGIDRDLLRLKVEFLLLAQTVCSYVQEKMDGGEEKGSAVLDRVRWILELGFRGLKSDEHNEDEVVRVDDFGVEVLSGLREVILERADVFDALCWNIHRQVHRCPEAFEVKLAESVSGDLRESAEALDGKFDAYVQIVKAVQMAHLNVLKEYTVSGDVVKAILEIRYLHPGFGVEELEYRMALKALLEKVLSEKSGYEEAENPFQKKMLLVYEQSLSANSIKLTHIIKAIQDELYRDEIENNQHILSENLVILLPLKKYLEALKLAKVKGSDDQTSQCMIVHSCIKDMYQYARVSGEHILESVTHCALSAVKREQFQEACDVLSLFPPLRPLVVAMGWDLLSGKTAVRKKLLLCLWTSKSQSFRLEEPSMYGKQSNEMSCVEYLCDLLCFQLDLASFVACTNSGHPWNSKDSMIFSRKQQIACDEVFDHSDEFVENFVLERLAAQTPLRVLFDVVPGLRFQDAIELISMQPTNSTTVDWKRMQDIELIHVRYALESAVLALGTIEKCVDDEKDRHYVEATWHLKNLRSHLASVSNIPRKVFTLSIIISLLCMDNININLIHSTSSSSYSAASEQPDLASSSEDGNTKVMLFTTHLLDILHCSVQDVGVEWQHDSRNGAQHTGKEALEWRVTNIKNFVEDWKWRLSILQNLLPLSRHSWSWKEALAVLRAHPLDLLNLCIQRSKYDIREEVVYRFSLPLEEKAALELAGWVDGTFRRIQAEDSVTQAAEGFSGAFQEISSICSQLRPLVAVLLCIDIAASSAKTADVCLQLLKEAGSNLSKIYPGGSSKIHSAYWDHLSEVTVISVIRHILRHLFNLLEQEKVSSLQEIFTGESSVSPFKESHKQRQHALAILHQIIDDAHKGKRQFLSGKLHNLSRVFADEEIDNEKKKLSSLEKGIVLGLGLKPLRSAQTIPASGEDRSQFAEIDANDSGKMLLSPISSKPSTYISSFIVYIATIGNIVDGIDTTHDFNFFSLVYEWPKDLLTRLVFERGSTDAAAKIADIMCSDFVHEVIAACVPPVFPPHNGHGWASIPFLPSLSNTIFETSASKEAMTGSSISPLLDVPVFSLKLDIVKHLAKSSPVRAILACVFGSRILSSGRLSSKMDSSNAELSQTPDTEQSLYEFALDQSEMFPTLNRWIKMLPNFHRVTESATLGILNAKVQAKTTLKRSREPENDTESDIDDVADGNLVKAVTCGGAAADHTNLNSLGSPKSHFLELGSTSLLSLNWENEGSYEEVVERLICQGNLKDALAISDQFLRNGASDHLLQLLIENGKETHSIPGQPPSDGAHKLWSNNWQYCLRLKDKQLAAKLALKYLQHWEFNDAMDVLTMCLCHLPQSAPIRNEVLKTRQALKKYNHILLADDSHGSWQGVETEYKDDPEGLALKLAGRGAVSAALEVAESASLSTDLRRELQGRQLVNLLTEDPLSGGGPAEASRFLSSLPDPNDALPVAMSAMQLLPDLHSKQLIVHFFLKRRSGNLSDIEISRLNSWALGLHVLAELPLPWQQRCSALHEHPQLILEVLLMMKQLQYASLLLKKIPSMTDDNLILTYSAKAIAVSVNSTSRESKTSLCDSSSRTKQKQRINISPKSNFTNSLSNLQKEARKAFSWALDAGNRGSSKEADRKRKGSGLMSSERATCEAMVGNQEDHSLYSADGQERTPFVPTAEEWVLTGDATKDDTVRSVHKYESAPDIVLFKGLLSLCSDELVSAKGAMGLCITQMKSVLSSQQLPLHASMEAISQAYHATEVFVQGLGYAKYHLKNLIGISDMSSNSGSRDEDYASAETSSSGMSSRSSDELSDFLGEAEIWLGRAELLQSLLGSGIIASLDDIIDKESSACLRDRLIKEELYSMAVYTSKKCKVDVFPVWNAWGHALIRMEHYAQARAKFKQALQLHKGDPSVVIQEIINTLESRPPIDASSVRCLYEHLAKSAPRIFDDSLSADAYLNVLYMPSTFPRTERSRLFHESTNGQTLSSSPDFEDGPRSNLDDIRYVECIYYFQEYDRPHMLQFMFQHGRYTDACQLFFPPNAMPLPPQPMMHGPITTSSQRLDLLATDYGTIEDLCGYCIGYDAMPVLEDILSARSTASQDAAVTNYIASCLVRICNYCELHKHFNFLYKFQVIRRDHVGAGLCCIQLFMNSLSQEEAVKHLENAEMHFGEDLSERSRSHGIPKIVSSGFRGKGVFGKFTEEGLLNLNACVGIQVDVIRSFNDTEGPQWTHSLFGNPNDPDTFRRRCQIAETLAEKNFDLAFGVICRFNLPAVDIYAAVAAALADKKRSNLLTLLFKNIRRTIDHDDWDQVLGAAINVYANKHKERPDKLIDMLNSSHRKVLACVVCGRLKSAFQIASRSGSVADVQYVAHQALHANALSVLDMCKQWLAQYS